MRQFLLLLFLCLSIRGFSQEKHYTVEANYFYGSIWEHNPNISHLITEHPHGMLLHFNRKTYGDQPWERRYNYPNVGFSLSYQDFKNEHLGENFGAYAHLGFYILNRHLLLKVGQGLAVTTNPYHPDDNYRNNAYGSRLLSSTIFTGNFQFENLIGGVGFQTGLSLIHYSNADFKSPNSSTNTIAWSAGLNYDFNHASQREFIEKEPKMPFSAPIRYNLVLRGGVNTTGVIGSESYPFLTISAYADKSLNHKSTLHAGAELFLSRALEEYIYFYSVAFPLVGTTGDEDAKRVGVFVGHQLTFRKLSFITHLGYYAYYPYDHYVDRIYNRIGLQREIYKDLFGSVTVRSHGANAEAVEFSIGYRL
ncbi:acyloxyacyl hydrolase [Salinimicrobium terrae]|uniref:acyloxyacyl hydrolase n=1 Tax=Salinimicrobium terrae TaxID=470866 RepID=UPI00048CDC88|nr:acyloxyacyl hydrolase [Salinimicrobium terrae]